MIGILSVALAHGARRGNGRGLAHAQEIQRQLALRFQLMPHGVLLLISWLICSTFCFGWVGMPRHSSRAKEGFVVLTAGGNENCSALRRVLDSQSEPYKGEL